MLLINELVGFGAVGKLSTLTLRSTSTTGIVPADAKVGDLIVMFAFSTGITGFTTAVSGFDFRFGDVLIITTKVSDGSDASHDYFSAGGRLIAVFYGDAPIRTATAFDPHEEDTAGDPVTQTVTSGAGATPLVVIGFYYCSSAVPITVRTMSPAKDAEITDGNNPYLAWKVYNSAPANVNVDMVDETAVPGHGNTLMSCYIVAT